MGRRIFFATFGGVITAILSWIISRPFAPQAKYNGKDPELERLIVGQLYGSTGANFYSLLLSFTFAFMFCTLCVWIFSSGRAIQARILSVLVGASLGAVLFTLIRFGFDHFITAIASKDSTHNFFNPLYHARRSFLDFLPWLSHVLEVSVLCFAVYFALGLQKKSWLTFAITVISTIPTLTFVVEMTRMIASTIDMFGLMNQILTAANSLNKKGFVKLADYDFLAQFPVQHLIYLVTLALCLGLMFGLVEMFTRQAWLVKKGKAKGGYYWSLDDQVIRIGCHNSCEIQLPQDTDFAPIHAQIQRHGSDYALVDLGTAGGTYLNGNLIKKAWLSHGDTIRTGVYSFEFSMRQPLRVTQAGSQRESEPPGPMNPTSIPIPQLVTGARLVDPFGTAHDLPEGRTVIGRDPVSDICLNWEPTVSSKHAEIVMDQAEVMLNDLGSSNGTVLNGVPLQGKMPLSNGDEILFGKAKMIYQVSSNPFSPLTP